ncbi:MAG: UDP-N-acetylglucosamine 2-epimerase (non-hydrolyzing) [Melioribacteraceae bacterium]|nr:UDP-N-acetylglucosamine 2-epimerase (non-hydrolyzing) [Melioribacteraceae bacterium]
MKIISVVGARPNFMKVAPIYRAFNKYNQSSNQLVAEPGRSTVAEPGQSTVAEPGRSTVAEPSRSTVAEPGRSTVAEPARSTVAEPGRSTVNHLICHTGQHYDEKMSKIFFDDLELPKPNYYLGVGGGSHAEQTARIMIEFEKVLIKESPDAIIVVGDVNSTIACGLTAKKLGVSLIHVEAGLRSFDMDMPEEINRILTDRISDLLFVTEKSGIENLLREGTPEENIHFVGHVMIDSLVYYLPKIKNSKILEEMNLSAGEFVLVTLHRPSNVDEKEPLEKLVQFFNRIAEKRKVVFPVHPRTKNNLKRYDLDNLINDDVILCDPIGYLDFQNLLMNCGVVITDSGGIQEESTYLGVQCITLRNSTERPITSEVGTNQVVGTDLDKAYAVFEKIIGGDIKQGSIPELWDGRAAERIVETII